MATREELQIALDARVAELRNQAAVKQAEAARIHGLVNADSAFWTQPAYGNAAGRAFARQRDRERAKLIKAGELVAEAADLLSTAARMESRGVVMAGDAAKARAEAQASVAVIVGQLVDTTFFGVRKVLKVNSKTVLVEGSFGPVKVEKQYLRTA